MQFASPKWLFDEDKVVGFEVGKPGQGLILFIMLVDFWREIGFSGENFGISVNCIIFSRKNLLFLHSIKMKR